MQRLINIVKNLLKDLKIDFSNKVVISLSGGADSIFLTELLTHIFPLENLICAHFNHNLRESAMYDENFVRQYCSDKNLKLIVKSIEVRDYSKLNKLSIETAARNLRYSELEKIIDEYNAQYLMTAHTLDDNIETFFMRVFRGAGLKGLRCIPLIAQKKKYVLIRPLLKIDKETIIAALNQNNISFANDETNFQSLYFRNKIRLELLPFIKNNFDNNLSAHINNLIELININNNFLENKINEILKKNNIIKIQNANTIKFDKLKYQNQEKYCRYEILRYLFSRLIDNNDVFCLYGFEAKHIYYSDDFILNGVSGHFIDLPFDLQLIIEFDNVCIRKKNTSSICSDFFSETISIKALPQKIKFLNYEIIIEFCDFDYYLKNHKNQNIFFLEYLEKEQNIIFRNLRNSDNIKLAKRNITKSLKKIFQEMKIGITDRQKYFGIEYNQELAHIPNLVETKYKELLFQKITNTKPEKIIKIEIC
ncbi:MAG TPA: tRNA lysidine(34) synthetase TilS [bacterium]|nr:tRNA lysidine(34) synthetase TilS [bacterium]